MTAGKLVTNICADCNEPFLVASAVAWNAPRCHRCRRIHDQKCEASRKQKIQAGRHSEHEVSPQLLWRIVAAPDMDAWGHCSAFVRGEVLRMIESKCILEGTILARMSDPNDRRIVKNGELRVVVG